MVLAQPTIKERTEKRPYLGLRPFSKHDARYFFGRRRQTAKLIERLGNSRFVAVIGESGSGKSSLVRAGLIPKLEAGLMVGATRNWRVMEMRPGSTPMHSLAKGIYESLQPEFQGNAHVPNSRVYVESNLAHRPKRGLPDLLAAVDFPKDTSLLIVVDQFEELFRYRHELNAEDADKLVIILLDAIKQKDSQIYVVITMRSDFIGQCSIFEGLPEMISESPFVVPRLDRESLEEAIIGPAKLVKSDVEPELVTTLCNEVSTTRDQLPVVQHALMRLYERDSASKHLTLDGYRDIGGVSNALDRHANEIFESLTGEEPNVAQSLFRCLTEKTIEGGRIRRPTKFKDIVAISGFHEDSIKPVITKFLDNSFLVLDTDVLDLESMIDITHESLIRNWTKLSGDAEQTERGWVDHEAMLAHNFRRICTEALGWIEKGKNAEDLLTGLRLTNAEEWKRDKEGTAPITKEWCSRHWDSKWKEIFRTRQDSDYATLVKDFIEESQGLRRRKLEQEERLKKQAEEEKLRALEAADRERKLKEEAIAARTDADVAKEKALEAQRDAERARKQAQADAEEQKRQKRIALHAKRTAESAEKKAKRWFRGAMASLIVVFIAGAIVWYQWEREKQQNLLSMASNFVKSAQIYGLRDELQKSALVLAIDAYLHYSKIDERYIDRGVLRPVCDNIVSFIAGSMNEPEQKYVAGYCSAHRPSRDFENEIASLVKHAEKAACAATPSNIRVTEWISAAGSYVTSMSNKFDCSDKLDGVRAEAFEVIYSAEVLEKHSPLAPGSEPAGSQRLDTVLSFARRLGWDPDEHREADQGWLARIRERLRRKMWDIQTTKEELQSLLKKWEENGFAKFQQMAPLYANHVSQNPDKFDPLGYAVRTVRFPELREDASPKPSPKGNLYTSVEGALSLYRKQMMPVVPQPAVAQELARVCQCGSAYGHRDDTLMEICDLAVRLSDQRGTSPHHFARGLAYALRNKRDEAINDFNEHSKWISTSGLTEREKTEFHKAWWEVIEDLDKRPRDFVIRPGRAREMKRQCQPTDRIRSNIQQTTVQGATGPK